MLFGTELLKDLLRGNVQLTRRTKEVFYDAYAYDRDEDRAADINAAFADGEVRGVIALRGGWGASRALPWIDFDLIAAKTVAVLS